MKGGKEDRLPTCLPFFLEIVRLEMMMMSRVRQHVYRFNIISAVKLTLWTVEHTLCTKLCSWAPHTHTHVIIAAISRNRLCAEPARNAYTSSIRAIQSWRVDAKQKQNNKEIYFPKKMERKILLHTYTHTQREREGDRGRESCK